LDVGDVVAGNYETTIYVIITTSDDWYINNAKVWYGTDANDLPVTKSSNPLRGKFPVNEDFVPSQTSITYTIDFNDIGETIEAGSSVYLSVHTNVEMEYLEDDEPMIRIESAWGEGTEIGGKAWGWYLQYEVQ
jgi:hypothetical protein